MNTYLLISVGFSLILITYAQQCQNAQVTSTSYTTQDATVLKHIAYISNFQIKCKRGDPGNLYALLGDVITPVASVGVGKYQISWTEDVKIARTGDIVIPVFNESGYSAAKKALRAGEDTGNVPTFTKIVINHPGIYVGPWISCEFLAVGFSVAIAYVAIHFRSKLLS